MILERYRDVIRPVSACFPLIVATLVSTSASAHPIEDTVMRRPTAIACVGDSITEGHGDSVPDGGTQLGPYPKQLQAILQPQLPGIDVQNYGRSGATLLSSGDIPYIKQPEYTDATKFVADAGAKAVVDVIIMLGTNDSKAVNWDDGAHAAEFTSDYIALIEHFASLPTKPDIYIMIPPASFANTAQVVGETTVNDIDPLIRQVAMKEGVKIIDLYTPTKGKPYLFDTGLHPTDAGYTLIANIVAASILSTDVDAGAPDGGAADRDAGSADAGASVTRKSGCALAGPPCGDGHWGVALGLGALVLVAGRRREARRRSSSARPGPPLG